MSDPFAPLDGGAGKGKAKGGKGGGAGGTRGTGAPAFVAVMPIPPDAPERPEHHPSLGAPAASWTYRDAAGAPIGYVCRFNRPDGSKDFRPLVLFRPAAGGPMKWRWESWPSPRPLYGLDRLAARPDAPVIVCEGEKSADAAGLLLPGHVAVASPNGSKSAARADWGPLAGRRVTVWPDADAPGTVYAAAVGQALRAVGAASVARIAPPQEAGEGWDAADALAAAWTPERSARLVAAASDLAAGTDPASAAPAAAEAAAGKSRPPGGAKAAGPPKRERRVRGSDELLALADACRLWHAADREAFATFTVDGHTETWPVNAPAFKDWLAWRGASETGTVPAAQAIEDAVRALRYKANRGPLQEPWMRTGWRDDRLYIDLCDERWRALEISGSPLGPDGRCWRVLEQHDLPFVRSGSMQALPVPEADDACAIEELRPFVNVENDADFCLVVAWLLGALRDRGPYPILVLNGSQGTGKSVLSTLLRSLVDPNAAPIRSVPRDDRDLFVAATNAHCICLDNMSSVPVWLADALCRVASGGGFAARSMYQDRSETVLVARRPVLLNGIPALTDRPDLASRAITVRLRALPNAERRPEDEMERAWEVARPRVLAALCDALSTAVRRLPDTRLDGSPRMADLTKWITAAESGLGWEPGAFMTAYAENQDDVREGAFEANPVAMALDAFARDRRDWTGTATQLLECLNDRVPESTKRLKVWPETAQALGNAMDRVAEPLLRPRGVIATRSRTKAARTITVTLAQ